MYGHPIFRAHQFTRMTLTMNKHSLLSFSFTVSFFLLSPTLTKYLEDERTTGNEGAGCEREKGTTTTTTHGRKHGCIAMGSEIEQELFLFDIHFAIPLSGKGCNISCLPPVFL